MRASTILPLVFIAASVGPGLAFPLAPSEESTTATVSTAKSTEPAQTTSYAQKYASHTGLHRGQHTTQRGLARLHDAHRHAGQRRPDRAAATSQRRPESAAIIGQRLPHQRNVASRPHFTGEQRYRRPHPSADRNTERPQHLSQPQHETRALEVPEETIIARAIADGLLTRDFDELLPRELEEELEARKVNWKKVGSVFGGIAKTALHFLREDGNGQLAARDIDEELLARELEKELEARKVNWKKVGSVFGGIAKTALHFLREDGEMPVYARELDDNLLERETAAGSGAISFKNILKDGEQFVGGIFKREDEEMYAREFADDELLGRDMLLNEMD